MEQREFDQLTRSVVKRFLPRMPAGYVRGFERVLNAGELTVAVEELVLVLVNCAIPVTAAERDDLSRLMLHVRQPNVLLSDLNVIAQA